MVSNTRTKGAKSLLLLFYQKIKRHYEITIIFIAGFIMRLYMAHIDPFLHEWDERFHAAVAKNLMRYPFKPMLTAHPVVPYESNLWCCNHIWLHKQPLFMWQMAASMKLFGVSEFTMRLPSAIMGALMILLIYRIALLATANKATAILAGLLLCCSHYQLELISGRFGMDHNDMAFGFYVLASAWAYFEYLDKAKWSWAVWVGVFAGCAILNKWLTGLIIYAPWGMKLVYDLFEKKNFRQVAHFLLSLVVCVAIFLPWQLYVFHAFPVEARYELLYNSKHISEAVEGHTGSIFFYLRKFHEYFGHVVWCFVFLGAFLLWAGKQYRKKYAFALSALVLIIFCFFSFVVKSKLISYFFLAVPFCILFIAVALYQIIEPYKSKKIIAVFITGLFVYYTFNPVEIFKSRADDAQRAARIYNTEVYKHLEAQLPANVNVVINVNEFEHPDVMFYNQRLTAYHWWFSEEDINRLAQQKVPVAAFEDHGGYVLPAYIKSYPYLYIIHQQLK